MPLYRYVCACGAQRDEVRKIDERDQAPECHGPMTRRIMPTMVSVFTPYRPIAIDKESGKRPLIRTREEHTAFLRRNGYEEVGNDSSMAPPHPEAVAEKQAIERKELAELATWTKPDV